MLMDDFGEFADATSVGTPNNSTVNCGDVIDLGVARDIGNGAVPIYLVIQVTTAITSAGAATVQFVLASDAGATLGVDNTQTEHIQTDDIPVATLVAGYQMVIPLPMENPAYERYLGFQVRETAGQALTGGNVNAFLTTSPSRNVSYADAVN